MTRTKCRHENTFFDDQTEVCEDCWQAVGIRCQTCGGQGVLQEDEYEGDFINYSNDLIKCPDCKGSGVDRR